jgi:hypothetical protein
MSFPAMCRNDMYVRMAEIKGMERGERAAISGRIVKN